MSLVFVFEIIGTFVFAVSGASTAAAKKFDILGIAIIALVTAFGGGTLRDVMIGEQPVSWMRDMTYIYTIILAVVLSFFFLPQLMKLRRTLFLFDTIGLGMFTILGIEKSLAFGLSPVVSVMMGTVSAVFGGVIRDTLCNTVPLIFSGKIYATNCIAGGLVYLVADHAGLDQSINMVCTVALIIVLRTLALKLNWALPTISGHKKF